MTVEATALPDQAALSFAVVTDGETVAAAREVAELMAKATGQRVGSMRDCSMRPMVSAYGQPAIPPASSAIWQPITLRVPVTVLFEIAR